LTVYALVTFGIQTVYNDSGINKLDGVYSAFLILNPMETYYICAADIIMCFQVVTTLSVKSVFVHFNKNVKRLSLEQASEETPIKLRTLMQTQVRLFGLLKAVDDILGLHTIIRLALAVPRTIYAVQEIEQMSGTEKIIVRSVSLWELRNEELDRVVTLFLLQLRQPGRGLSAGGLVTITNRLILTV
ncbi:hypothetical protein AAVH_22867, partial [Aphelenchoides avenae]